MLVYLDETGDLGWSFDRPYQSGGSSRYLVIAALIVPPEHEERPKRKLRHIYQRRGWNPQREKKWVTMSPEARTDFARQAAKLLADHPDIRCRVIVVHKERVQPHIRTDGNKLYNYMTKLLPLDELARYPRVTLIPDPRSIKVQSGNSLPDYLQTELWFTKDAPTRLEYLPTDSRHCLNLQFTDMIAGVIGSHFEFRQSRAWDLLQPHISLQTLFFR